MCLDLPAMKDARDAVRSVQSTVCERKVEVLKGVRVASYGSYNTAEELAVHGFISAFRAERASGDGPAMAVKTIENAQSHRPTNMDLFARQLLAMFEVVLQTEPAA